MHPTRTHRGLRSAAATVATALAVASVAVTLAAVPANAAPWGAAPDIRAAHHLQRGPHQLLRWAPVPGATAYQVYVKATSFRHRLPREWRLFRTVERNQAKVFVPASHTRQFGVRAVGRADGARKRVTPIASFGTLTRPPARAALVRQGGWSTVRGAQLYRRAAFQTRRPGARLTLPAANQTSAVRLIATVGPRFGVVDVLVDGERVRRIDLGRRRHRPAAGIHVSIPRPRPRDGAITVVNRSRKPVRISTVAQLRPQSHARRTPPAPIANPPARSFTVTGSGWGHGVGLSQYGAKEMAEDGRSPAQILRHYYRGTEVARRSDNRLLDVSVGHQSRSVQARLRGLSRDASARVCAMRGARCVARVDVRDATSGRRTAGLVTMSRVADGRVRARVSRHGGKARTITGDRIRIRWSGTRYLRGPAGVIRLQNGLEYRHGQLSVVRAGSSSVHAVLTLRLQDEYLRGVAEVPSSWHPSALRTQAIIARTYALKTGAGRKSDCGCHLRDSVVHQAYGGWSKEREGWRARYGKRWVDAVEATAGQVVEYAGQLAGTYYYSSSGGNTLNSQDVWSSTVPYLQSVRDPWSLRGSNSNRVWTQTFSQARMAGILGLRDIHRIEVTDRYEGGAVRTVKATASNGRTVTVGGKADTMRGRFGLKSAFVRSITEKY